MSLHPSLGDTVRLGLKKNKKTKVVKVARSFCRITRTKSIQLRKGTKAKLAV